jgi:hypothetical protein
MRTVPLLRAAVGVPVLFVLVIAGARARVFHRSHTRDTNSFRLETGMLDLRCRGRARRCVTRMHAA